MITLGSSNNTLTVRRAQTSTQLGVGLYIIGAAVFPILFMVFFLFLP